MIRVLLSVLVVISVLLGLAGGAAYWAWWMVETPLNTTQNSTVVFTVESGESLHAVTGRLERDGLLRWGQGAYYLGRSLAWGVQAGEFELAPSMSSREILDILAHGQPLLHRLHFAEGLTMSEVAQAVHDTGLTTAEQFLQACRDQDYLHRQGLNATTAEGYLFPETYFFPRIAGQNPYPILDAILERFQATVRGISLEVNATTLHEMVILASLVEKETAIASERPTVAGVYANRLQRGMLLQCDPTIIYGLGLAFDGNLTRTHLRDAANPYNTYAHPGLPPGPICSPGKAALLAAAQPEQHALLFFVARPDGSHHFSRTLIEHNNAVIKYQRRGRPLPGSRTAK